jgi:hypothetical protein
VSALTPRRYIFAEGRLMVAEVQVRTVNGERTAYHVTILGTQVDMEIAHPSGLRGIVFQNHGLGEMSLMRLSNAIDRELRGKAA